MNNKYVTKFFEISSVDKMLTNKVIRDDHPMQRYADQWTPLVKSNYIGTILNGYPVPSAILVEQNENNGNIVRTYLVDGKQRWSTAVAFRHNLLKISSKVERPLVEYIENGSGEVKTFDIRRKFYKDLPESLRDAYDCYQLSAVIHLDCSNEDLEYHIRRYNNCKPMTAAQRGITFIGTAKAGVLARLAMHPFFKDGVGNYSQADKKNSNFQRIIAESVMAINFLDQWKMNYNELCSFLDQNTSTTEFDTVEDTLDRFVEMFGENAEIKAFNIRDTFIWIAAFDKFKKFGLPDDRFGSFVYSFDRSLKDYVIDGVSYTKMSDFSGSKHAAIIRDKLTHIEKLMCQFFEIEYKASETDIIDIENNASVAEYVDAYGSHDVFEELKYSDESKKKSAIKTLMLLKGSEEKPQDFVDACEEDDIYETEGIEIYLDMMYEIVMNIGVTTQMFNVVNFSTILAVCVYGDMELKIQEEMIYDFLSKKSPDLNIPVISYKKLCGDLVAYVNYKTDKAS